MHNQNSVTEYLRRRPTLLHDYFASQVPAALRRNSPVRYVAPNCPASISSVMFSAITSWEMRT